jgi:hypothetical protein
LARCATTLDKNMKKLSPLQNGAGTFSFLLLEFLWNSRELILQNIDAVNILGINVVQSS